MTQPTCGDLFRTLAEKVLASVLLEDASDINYRTYALGFISGQAEKVYNGSCPAFMIRPAPDWWEWTCEAIALVCTHYGLQVMTDTTQGELWGFKDPYVEIDIENLRLFIPVNSRLWHITRARLCGIKEVDDRYHERQGYRVRCEPEG